MKTTSMLVARVKHRAKVAVGAQLTKILRKQFFRGKGPAGRLVRGLSQAAETGIEAREVFPPIEIPMATPEFCLEGEIDREYLDHLRGSATSTATAGVITAENVDVSFPTGMHQAGKRIIQEAMLAPYVVTNPKYYFALESLRFKSKQPMEEGVLLATPWHHNFFHWMIEILPRLSIYERCPELHHLPLIVPKSSRRFISDSLALSGYLPKTVFLPDGAYRFKRLHLLAQLASPACRVSPDAVDWLNNTIRQNVSKADRPRRLYISRRDAKIRYVINEPELEPVLADFGFKIVSMSGMSLADQIELFRSAECIVGPHGAAFAHLVFAQPGTKFIEFFPPGHWTVNFNRICGIKKLRYGFLVGRPAGLGGYSVDPSALRSVLSQALGQGCSASPRRSQRGAPIAISKELAGHSFKAP